MKILILTSRFGMGHYCTAEAIKEELLQSDSDAIIDIVDIVQVLFPIIYKVIYKFFNLFICRFSGIYNFTNSFATKNEDTFLKRRYLNKINLLLKRYEPDCIISTWSACSRYVSTYKDKFKEDLLLYTYITDITVHDGWIADRTDMYFVATEGTKKILISKGVHGSKIVVSGIPVRKSFKEELQSNTFHNEQNLSINSVDLNFKPTVKSFKDKKKILIMGGGLGIIPDLDNILGELNEIDSLHITVITGKNKKLFKRLKGDYPNIEVIGYTNQVHQYMKRADLLITKPGGISTFEAIYTNTPLYVIRPFLSQEVGNAKFIEEMFIGKIIWENDFNISEDIIALINDEQVIKEMRCNMENLRREFSQFNLRKIYERNVKKYVDYDTASGYSIIYNDIWSYSHVALQKVE